MSSQPLAVAQPTPDERSMAMISYVLAFFIGFLGPLIIFFIKRESLFVKLHALQLLIWHIAITILIIGGCLFFFVVMVAGVAGAQATGHDQPPLLILALFPVIIGGAVILGIANIVLTILGAIKANEGVWWRLPVAGHLAEKFLGVQA